MSALLFGIGFKAKMGTPVRKLLLLKMIDACEDDGSRIFPANETMAMAAECSVRQVQRETRAFLDVGLLRLVREGGKGPRSTNEYALNLGMLRRLVRESWDAVWAEACGAITRDGIRDGRPRDDMVSPLREDEKDDTGDIKRVTLATEKGDKLGHTTPPDPSFDPSSLSARERAVREGDLVEDHLKKIDAEGWSLLRDWPGFAGMPKEPALKIWQQLSPDDRAEAKRKFPAWLQLLRRQMKSYVPAPSTYFTQQLWTAVTEEDEKPIVLEAAPFGKLWMAARFKALLGGPIFVGRLTAFERTMVEQGKAIEAELMRDHQARSGWPSINEMTDRAEYGQSWTVPASLKPIAELMVPLWSSSDCELIAEWELEHKLRGWPWLPKFKADKPLFFPQGRPGEALAALATAIERATQKAVA